jgi:hypothetical protein
VLLTKGNSVVTFAVQAKATIALLYSAVSQSAISVRTFSYALFGLLLFVAACKKQNDTSLETRQSPRPTNAQPATNAQGVCALLTKEEIQAVQDSPVRETKSSLRTDGGLRIAECFYTAEDYSKSVILTHTQSDITPQSPRRDLKEIWVKTFHRDFDKEEQERETPTKPVSGIGDEAYWSGGSLYVFTKNSFIRIAIGGPESEVMKIQRLKTLAEKIVPRL